MKKRNPFLPVVLTAFSIASIGMLYAKTASIAKVGEDETYRAPINAHLQNVSGSELLLWLKNNQIEFISENKSDIQKGSYTVYLENASPDQAVEVFADLLNVEWRRVGQVYVLTPESKRPAVKSLPRPVLMEGLQQASADQPVVEADKVERPPQIDALVESLTPEQRQTNRESGYLPTSELTSFQKETLRKHVNSDMVDLSVLVDGRTVRIKGEL